MINFNANFPAAAAAKPALPAQAQATQPRAAHPVFNSNRNSVDTFQLSTDLTPSDVGEIPPDFELPPPPGEDPPTEEPGPPLPSEQLQSLAEQFSNRGMNRVASVINHVADILKGRDR